jgi:peptide-methionine (S)-S-oxide reductase
MNLATFGNGCFWCTEAIFTQLKGVKNVRPGYTGGKTQNPSYEEVCAGQTGHAEVIQIEFDPAIISFQQLLEVFWKTHDPTTLNRQGNDIGTQYRSSIFCQSAEQMKVATATLEKLKNENIWKNPIVTEITTLEIFYPAEDYHKNYYDQHGDTSYCYLVITPKIEKFKAAFKDKIETGD